MKRKIAAQWADALRSGKYKQGIRRLRDGEYFCCLGVLCNLHAQAHPEIAAEQTDPNCYMEADLVIPLDVMKWAGMSSASGDFGTLETLASLNDKGWSFDQLANIIDQNWKQL